MTRLLTCGAALAVTLVLTACGGGGDGGPADSATTAGGKTTVSVRQVDGVGKVLVDARGKAVYSSDVEAAGKVRCSGACTSFWEPLTVESGTPTAPSGAGKLSVAKRPDGTRQITADGKLLYTFSEDAPGKVEGNGFTDDFNGRHFTWKVVLSGRKAASDASPRSGYGY